MGEMKGKIQVYPLSFAYHSVSMSSIVDMNLIGKFHLSRSSGNYSYLEYEDRVNFEE
jgi:hypothetical protein